MTSIAAFAEKLQGVDVLFHTAAYFRDSLKGGGKHWEELFATNVQGTVDLLSYAYRAGVRRVVHTSSNLVLWGPRSKVLNETMRRDECTANDYGRAKILSNRAVDRFLEPHSDMSACMVLPGWMFGPGDIGPTSSGQLILDFLGRKLPGMLLQRFPWSTRATCQRLCSWPL